MRSPARGSGPALLVLLAAIGLVAASSILAVSARAEAPAHWRPLLLAHPADVRPPAPPLDGSAQDRTDLDELVTMEATAARHQAAITNWTSQPSPTRWDDIFLAQVRDIKLNPVRTSRALGLLNAAMYDAVIAACDAKIAFRRSLPHDRDGRITSQGAADDLSAYASGDAAVAAAAQAVLTYLLPSAAATYTAAATESMNVRMWTGMATRSDVQAGAAIGAAVGALAVARGKSDGANAVFTGTIPSFPGSWKAAGPFAQTNPIPDEPLAGTWKPWFMTSGSEFRPGPPPAYKSPAWQKDADELVSVTNNLTDDQLRIARFWADGAGTDTPPGHWMRIAISLALRDHLSLAETARVMAYLGTAQADAFIACWDAKYTYWTGRPITLIPGFASTIATPNFPSYPSGHATMSGAGSVVLAAFFPDDQASLAAMATEAAQSRLYGGIHYRTDNDDGLTIGRMIGQLVGSRLSADGGAQ